MASNSATIKDDFTSPREDDFLAVFSCPVCLGLYVNPKILPKCGHSFCLKCIESIMANKPESKSTIICPECRAESHLGYSVKVAESLQTNVQIQRAVEFVRESSQQGASRRTADPEDTCPHLALIKAPAICGHCKGNYCQSCFFRHMERVRVEIAWVGSGFEERWKKAVEKLAASADSITSAIEEQVKKAQEKVDQEMAVFEATVKESIRQNRKRLLDKAREIGDEQLAKMRRLLETANEKKDIPDSLKTKIQKVSNSSLLHCSTKELSKLYTKVSERDHEIFDLEEMQSVPKLGELTFQPDENLKNVLKEIEESGKGSLNWMIAGQQVSQKSDESSAPTEIARYHNAVKSGDLATVKEMLSRLPPACHAYACDHRDDSDFKQTPLMQAAENGRLEMVKFFVEEKKANLFARNNEVMLSLAIHLAAEEGHLDIVAYLIERCPEMLEIGDDYGNTPLCRAVMTGQMKVVKWLLEEKKANIEAKGQHGRTPLLLAAETGQLEIMKYLLEQKSDLTAKDTANGGGAIFTAVEFGHLEIVRYLLEIDPDCVKEESTLTGNSVLLTAIEKNRFEIAKFFVEEMKLDVNKKNKNGMTALIIASMNGNVEIVKFLIEKKADLMVKCKRNFDDSSEFLNTTSGNSAIHFAAKMGHDEVVACLLDARPELADVKNEAYKTPLMLAKAGQHENVIRVFNKRAAKIDE